MKINDRVKQKNTMALRTGKIIGIWEKDEYIINSDGELEPFACKGEYKVKFDNDSTNGFVTFSEKELIKL